MILPCKGCEYCSDTHDNGLFDPSKSSTFNIVNEKTDLYGWKCQKISGEKCYFNQGYSEGSVYDGYFVEDFVKFGMEENKEKDQNFVFGCAVKETGEFYKQKADGILGIGLRN